MLKRISKIQNVGKFRNCNSGAVELRQITVIHGLNTYGKSTLTDILKSLKNNDGTLIKKRLSIPEDQVSQEVRLGFQVGDKETVVLYRDDRWSHNIQEIFNLHIYDEDFYHQNLFASREFTRATKEQFSAFVLGRAGVDRANVIAGKNRLKGELVRARARLTKDAFSGVADIKNFLALPVDKPIAELEQELDRLRGEWVKKSSQQQALQSILARPLFVEVEKVTDVRPSLANVNEALQATFVTENLEAKRHLEAHIERCFKSKDKAEAWIRQGLAQNNGKDCQFCGQSLDENALHLLEQYRKSFDASFDTFRNETLGDLERHRQLVLNSRPSTNVVACLSENSKLSLIYSDLAREELSDLYKRIETLEYDIRELKELACDEFDNFGSALEVAVKAKSESPQRAVSKVCCEALILMVDNYNGAVEEYNAAGLELNLLYGSIKESLRVTDYQKELQELKNVGELQRLKVKRIEKDEQCKELEQLDSEISILEKEIPELILELQKEQSEYLDSFFRGLNENFKKFGSRDFQLTKAINKSGHVPVYHLKVSFRGKEVSESNIDRIFSESDRRALALAVFWTSIIHQSEQELRKSVIVFDDPVTSFDINRRHTVHRELINVAAIARQVIVLSHFDSAVVDILGKYKRNKDLAFCQIANKGKDSVLDCGDIDAFCRNEHEKRRAEIMAFIDQQGPSPDDGCLRIFLEYEIDHRFAKQIITAGISNVQLSEKIDALFEHGVISKETQDLAHRWREDLNADHHRWSDANEEEKRQIAHDFFEFVYGKLNVAEIS
ncbi:AAA family ATPase [Stutzerimonas balearica]|uniref:AAA family ATPase n=1 Tax=Stutzerimonas balearica TaxID=74829 RepID=UPI0028B1194C|nr:AAA family ATPase [Stutzerimonas balearica]